MKSIRISDETYKFLKTLAKKERRSITKTLDLFVQLFEENGNECIGVEEESISNGKK